MENVGSVVVIGGVAGIGLEIAKHYAQLGREVIISSRNAERARASVADIGGKASGIELDLTKPEALADQLADLRDVEHVVLSAIERDQNTVRDFDVEKARALVTLKLLGYTEAVHALAPHVIPSGSVVIFGGLAKDRPYPGSTTVTIVNGGVTAMVRTMALELAPIRVNGLHPAIVGDSPFWSDKPPEVLEGFRSRTPLGRLVSTQDVVGATVFLLESPAVTGVNLRVDGGWMLT